MKGVPRLACDAASSILRDSLEIFSSRRGGMPHVVLVVSKSPCKLSQVIVSGYRDCLTQHASLATHSELVFDPSSFVDDLRDRVGKVGASGSPTACVLIQPSAFQNELKKYRLRLQLFEMGLRVAEHAHLSGMPTDDEVRHYLAACTFVGAEAKMSCERVMKFIEPCTEEAEGLHRALTVVSRDGSKLTYSGVLEKPLSNDGCYALALQNEETSRLSGGIHPETSGCTGKAKQHVSVVGSTVGGTFPVGEVITEACDLGTVNGVASFFAYPNTDKKVCLTADPFQLTVERGIVTNASSNTPAAVHELLDLVRSVDKEPYVRELGIGVNPHLGKKAILSDVTAFERQWGVHVSLGKRHPLFVKQQAKCRVGPALRRKDGVFHIDLFLDAASIEVEGCGSMEMMA